MEPCLQISRIIVQSDWEDVFKNKDEKVWISYKKAPGEPSIHGELVCNGLASTGQPYVFPSEGFTVKSVSQRNMVVSYDDLETRFVAPLVTYATVHKYKKSVECLDVTSGGLAVSSDVTGACNVWTLNNGEVRRTLSGHAGDVYTCQFFPSGVVILTGGADTQLKIWSAESGDCAATLTGHQAGITCTAIVDRGRNVISGSRDGTAKMWDVSTQTCLATYAAEGGVVNGCSLGVAGEGVKLEQPDEMTSEQEVGTQDKLLLVATESGQLTGFGAHSKKKVFEYTCTEAVNCCCFLSDTKVICGTQNSELHLLDLRNPSEPLSRTRECRSAILSLLPHGDGYYASTGDGSCFYRDAEHRNSCLELTGPDCDPVYRVVSDGQYIYTCCRDSFIRKYAAP